MGARDFRVAVGFFDHPKTVKLERRFGAEGTKAILRLWAWATDTRPEGNLDGMTAEDIAIACKWAGDPGDLVTTLVDLRWIDRLENGDLELHQWEEHNGWAYGAKRRSEVAKLNAETRWERERARKAQSEPECDSQCEPQCESMPPALPIDATRNAPSPSPSPSPSQTTLSAEPTSTPSKTEPDPDLGIDPALIVEAWNDTGPPVLPKVSKLTSKRLGKLRSRIREGPERREPGWWRSYFQRIAATPFLCGSNNRKWKADFDFSVESEDHVTRILEGSFDRAADASAEESYASRGFTRVRVGGVP